jgi:hypothetical protein
MQETDFYRTIGKKNVKSIDQALLRLFICVTFFTGVLFSGCLNTQGNLKLRGKVFDESTKDNIADRQIIVHGLVEIDEKSVPVDAGQFYTDSSGCFSYTLRKVKDARFYNFSIVGDSDYSFMTKKLGLLELKQNSGYLFFSLKKLVDLSINIHNKIKTPFCDTLYLSWKSDGVDFKILYPYAIDNYGKTDNFIGLTSYFGLEWVGRDTHSAVRTRVFADKLTKIRWELVRNKKRKEITDTITCRNNIKNIVYFTY